MSRTTHVTADVQTNWSARRKAAAAKAKAKAPTRSPRRSKPLASQNVTKPHTLKKRALSPRQHAAIALIMAGKHDAAVGEGVGVTRETVCRWRNADPLFIAELNRLRREVWAVASQRFDHLIINALGVLETMMKDRYDMARFRAAAVIMKAGAKHLAPPSELLDAEKISDELEELGVETAEDENPDAQPQLAPAPAAASSSATRSSSPPQSCPIGTAAAVTASEGSRSRSARGIRGGEAGGGNGDLTIPDRPPAGTLTSNSRASGDAP